jgi:hypothetical protein
MPTNPENTSSDDGERKSSYQHGDVADQFRKRLQDGADAASWSPSADESDGKGTSGGGGKSGGNRLHGAFQPSLNVGSRSARSAPGSSGLGLGISRADFLP